MGGAGWNWVELGGAGWSWVELGGAGWSWVELGERFSITRDIYINHNNCLGHILIT